jgi:hypothetical protein
VRIVVFLAMIPFIFLAGCAGTKTASSAKQEYVEIDNPGYTMSPNAPPTIWVPRSYVDSGVPRGSELVKQGYQAVKGGIGGSEQPQESQPGVAAVPAVPTTPRSASVVPCVRNRVAVLEIGKNGLQAPFSEMLNNTGSVILLDQTQMALLGRYAAIATQPERSAFAVRLQEDYGTNVVIFVSAPDSIAPGKTVKAELYDCMGGGLVRTVEATIPNYSENDPSAKSRAVSSTLTKLTEQTRNVLSLLPWFGKVMKVEGERVYINAGKEAGIRLGQMMKVYRGGKVVQGLGFAPGTMVGTVQVGGYVGTNGAYCVIKEGSGVQVSDLVAVE